MRTTAGILLAALVFVACWLAVHPQLPQLPNGDVYTSLGVARHLARGEGLVNDTVYPLFTAYPWGQTVPQPLVHRPPGLAFLLLPAYWLAGGDPVRTEDLIRPTMAVGLFLLAWLGLRGLRRQDRLEAGPAYLLLLLFNPLFGLAVGWGWGEIPCAVLLLALWLLLRWRGPADLSLLQSAWFAALAGLLALVRSDLLWVPVLWWLIVGLGDRRRRRAALVRRTLLCAVVGVAILLPWWQHVAQHTGKLFGNPLTDAIQIDLSEPWWDYPHLRSREPIPLGENLRENPGPALHKTAWGVRHFTRTLGDWLPWLFWFACLLLWAHRTWRRHRRGHPLLRAAGPAALPALTLPLLMAQYAFFSPETRHMLPLLPLFAWIGVALAAGALRPRVAHRWIRGAILTAVTGLALWLTPPQLGGEDSNVRTARALERRVAQVAATTAALPPGPVFSDNAAVPWRTDRPCVWSPFDVRVEAEIRRAIPAMAGAPWVRILPAQ